MHRHFIYQFFLGRSERIQLDENILQDRHQKPQFPVMVWFHGGGYVRGGSHQFGPAFLMREDIVLVTVNYRLGVLGNSFGFTTAVSQFHLGSIEDPNFPNCQY
jgi:hypothetical protein